MSIAKPIADWWLTNARIKHGHPSNGPMMPDGTPPASKPKWLAPALVAASLIGGPIAGGLATWWMTRNADQPTQAVGEPAEKSGSLYQYLEDGGFHVDESGG